VILDSAVYPASRSLGIGQDFGAQRFWQPCADLRDDLRGDPIGSKGLERLNDQALSLSSMLDSLIAVCTNANEVLPIW
jgi:hypothetical protein